MRTLHHLSSAYASYRPSAQATTTAHLTVRVNLPGAATAPQARLIVVTKTGGTSILRFALNSSGDGALRVGFGRTAIARVDLVVSNASTAFACWHRPATVYSCQGVPQYDSGSYRFSAAYSAS